MGKLGANCKPTEWNPCRRCSRAARSPMAFTSAIPKANRVWTVTSRDVWPKHRRQHGNKKCSGEYRIEEKGNPEYVLRKQRIHYERIANENSLQSTHVFRFVIL